MKDLMLTLELPAEVVTYMQSVIDGEPLEEGDKKLTLSELASIVLSDWMLKRQSIVEAQSATEGE